MNNRAALIVFLIVFSVSIFAIVLLPFYFGRDISEEEPDDDGVIVELEEDEDVLDQGFFRSDNGGQTWQRKILAEEPRGSIASFRVNRLVLDPVDSSTLYLLTNGNGLWASDNRGDSWNIVSDETGALALASNVLDLQISPIDPREWYVAAFQDDRGRVFRSDTDGASFREIYFTSRERFGVFDLEYDRSRRAIEIVTGQGGYLESVDKGRTWRLIRWFADGILELVPDPTDPDTRFIATSRGNLFRTRDLGTRWLDVTQSLAPFSGANENQRWVVDQFGVIYLGSSHGLLRSFDQAESFEFPPIIVPPDALPVLAIALDPNDTSRFLISAANQLYLTEDSGQSWSIIPSPSEKRITHLAFNSEDPRIIYAIVQP